MKSVERVIGNVFNIQRFSIQDGPGIRTTVFLKECPLKCLWCSNPESQSPFPEVAHRDSLCTGCGECLKACASGANSLSSIHGAPKIKIDRDKCINCGKCIDVCIAGARKAHGQRMSVDEVFDEIRRDISFYSKSGGGVTASGGEPLCQADFVTELFRWCRRIGIHTAIDTCGYASVTALKKVLSETDLVLYDMKLMNSKQHRKFTGKYNGVILRNARMIVAREVRMMIRIPFIPGVNDSEENLAETARFVLELNKNLHVDLLPYHRLGESKYTMMDREYQLKDVRSPGEEELQRAVGILRRYDLDCDIQR